MIVLKLLLCTLLLFTLVQADCVHYVDNTALCCTAGLDESSQACIVVSVENAVLKFQQYYADALMNEMTFQIHNPPLDGSNCVASEELGWCLLLTNFYTNSTMASGTLISTLSDQQGNNILTNTQGSFHVNHHTSVSPMVRMVVADPCSELCLQSGGCKCMQNTGCYCCSNPTITHTCVQVGGVAEIRFLRSTLYVGGSLWLTSVSRGDIPQPVCAVNDSGKTLVCSYINDLEYTRGIRGSTSSVIITEHTKEHIFSGDFIIL